MSRKNKMSAETAMSLVDDDLPDGAYFAMAAEMGGFDDVSDLSAEIGAESKPSRKCTVCGKKATHGSSIGICLECRAALGVTNANNP